MQLFAWMRRAGALQPQSQVGIERRDLPIVGIGLMLFVVLAVIVFMFCLAHK